MGGIVVICDEGGTVVGDVENLKISIFWTFRVFVFLWVELFLRLSFVRRRRDANHVKCGMVVRKRQNV